MLWMILTLASSVFIAFHHVQKKTVLSEIDIQDSMMICMSFMMIALAPFVPYLNTTISWLSVGLIFLVAVLGFIGGFLLNKVYKNSEVSTVAPLLNINPILVILFSYLILGETLNKVQMMGVSLVILGGYVVTVKSIRELHHPFTSMPKINFLYLSITLVLWAILPPIKKYVIPETGFFTLFFLFILFLFLINAAIQIYRKRVWQTIGIAVSKRGMFSWYAASALFGDLLYFIALSLPGAMVSLIIPFLRNSTLITVFLGGRIFHEKQMLLKSSACTMMVIGLFVLGLFS